MEDFKTWITRFVEADHPISDLADHIIKDSTFPKTLNYELLKGHISRMSYHSEALFVFESVFKFYSADVLFE